MINIAILYEGKRDTKPLVTLVQRIAAECGVEVSIDQSNLIKCYGEISDYILGYADIYLGNPDIDLVIYCGDQDRKNKSQRTLFTQLLKQGNPSFMSMSVVGVADVHFEAWLIADQDNFKKMLEIQDHTLPLSFFHNNPKRCLKKYWGEWDRDEKPSEIELMQLLAETADLSKIAKEKNGFNQFRSDLSKKLKRLS